MLHVHTFISGVQKPSKMGILRSDYPNVYINQCSIVLHVAISCWRTFLDCVLLIVYILFSPMPRPEEIWMIFC